MAAVCWLVSEHSHPDVDLTKRIFEHGAAGRCRPSIRNDRPSSFRTQRLDHQVARTRSIHRFARRLRALPVQCSGRRSGNRRSEGPWTSCYLGSSSGQVS